jgi:hypothetical protein
LAIPAFILLALAPAEEERRRREAERDARRGLPPTPRRKQCPDCAETIKAEARVCKHCGFRFEEPAGVG